MLAATAAHAVRLRAGRPVEHRPRPRGRPRREVVDDGKTLTVRIRRGVRFGPPVNREVTSRDVKYAIERGFNPNVANPYASTYYGDVVGADRADGGPIAGIETPDDHTLVFRLTSPTASLLAQSTRAAAVGARPARVREAARREERRPSTATTSSRPARTCSRPTATARVLGEGYVPGRSVRLVRNPNWDAASDDRPAYLDAIEWRIGGSTGVSGRQVLDGEAWCSATRRRPRSSSAPTRSARDQIFFSPGAGNALRRAQHGDPAVRRRERAQGGRRRARPRADAARARRRGRRRRRDRTSSTPACSASRRPAGTEGTGVDFLAEPGGRPERSRPST